MTNKTAVVTGASRGIGRACAIGLASLGYRVALVARDETALNAVRDEIAQLDGSASTTVHSVDLTDDVQVDELIANIKKQYGHVNVFVNNAGIDVDGTLDVNTATLDRVLHTNLRAPFLLLRQLVPLMNDADNPYVFNIASRAGKIGFAGGGVYGATKFALVGLNESLYREFADSPIRITAICPGWVNTDMADTPRCPVPPDDLIQVEDIFSTLEWLLSLSPKVCVRDVLIECKGSIA